MPEPAPSVIRTPCALFRALHKERTSLPNSLNMLSLYCYVLGQIAKCVDWDMEILSLDVHEVKGYVLDNLKRTLIDSGFKIEMMAGGIMNVYGWVDIEEWEKVDVYEGFDLKEDPDGPLRAFGFPSRRNLGGAHKGY